MLVTGATGFIGSWIIKNLLDQGYSVIGTVRSEDKGKILTETYQSVKFSVIHDLSIPNVYDHVFKDHSDIAYVIHTASPVLASSTDIKKEIIDPAVHGTKSLLSAAKEFGKNVKKIVFSSSIAAMMQPPSFGNSDPNVTFVESLENPIDETSFDNEDYSQLGVELGYVASKTFAEKEIWKFIESEKPSFAVTTVHLPFVWGPPILNKTSTLNSLNASNTVIAGLFNLPNTLTELPPAIPNVALLYIDVRDAASIHVKALFAQELDNKRALNIAGATDAPHIIETLREVNPLLKETLPNINAGGDVVSHSKWDDSYTQGILKIEYLPLKETLKDLAVELQKLLIQ